MANIERLHRLDKGNLSGEFYFSSLLEEAVRGELLGAADIERIQQECLALLAERVKRYTGGDSSSVRVELAESILQSAFYTIGLYLKSLPEPEDAVKLLTYVGIAELYDKGRKRIDSKLKAARALHHTITAELFQTANHTYYSTVVSGIDGFFKIYNPDFEAQEIYITADYPLCNPVSDLVGIEFIERYLWSIYYENKFCRYFSPKAIHHLLCGVDERYSEMVFNIFEQVLTCSLGCVMAKTEVQSLRLFPLQVEGIYSELAELSKEEVKLRIDSACQELTGELGITDRSLLRLIEKALDPVLASVWNGIKNDRLEKVFVSPKYPEEKTIQFSMGKKMEDERYRRVVEELREGRFAADKLAVLRSEVHSLADLEDILLDAELTEEEITAVLNAFFQQSDMEIAALIKRHEYGMESEETDLSESEKILCQCLHQLVCTFPPEKRFRIEEIKKAMVIDG